MVHYYSCHSVKEKKLITLNFSPARYRWDNWAKHLSVFVQNLCNMPWHPFRVLGSFSAVTCFRIWGHFPPFRHSYVPAFRVARSAYGNTAARHLRACELCTKWVVWIPAVKTKLSMAQTGYKNFYISQKVTCFKGIQSFFVKLKTINVLEKFGVRSSTIGTLSKPRRRRQRGHGKTIDLLGRTITQHVRLKILYIS